MQLSATGCHMLLYLLRHSCAGSIACNVAMKQLIPDMLEVRPSRTADINLYPLWFMNVLELIHT